MNVITYPYPLTCEQKINLTAELKAVMPNTKFLILEDGADMHTVKPARRIKTRPSLMVRRLR